MPTPENDRMRKLERQVAQQEHEIHTLASLVAIATNATDVDPVDNATKHVDQIWSCKKCSSRLGFYDPEEDLLRVRYKDFVAWIRLGQQGVLKLLCRSCSEINTVDYVPEAPNMQPVSPIVHKRQGGSR